MTKNKSQVTNNKSQTNSEEFDAMKNQLARAMDDYDNLQKKTDDERGSMNKQTIF